MNIFQISLYSSAVETSIFSPWTSPKFHYILQLLKPASFSPVNICVCPFARDLSHWQTIHRIVPFQQNSCVFTGTRRSDWSRRRGAAWSARKLWTKRRLRSLAATCWSCRPRAQQWRAPGRPRLRHRVERRPIALRARQLWSRPSSSLRPWRLKPWVNELLGDNFNYTNKVNCLALVLILRIKWTAWQQFWSYE